MPLLALTAVAAAQITGSVRDSYTKIEAMIPMRDGVKLYTAIYVPKDNAKKWPILMQRTPYGSGPYGEGKMPVRLGPTAEFQRSGYIFVNQDVRGRWMSEGTHVYSPPPKVNPTGTEHDESTDAFDTIEWLLKNVPSNNGAVGIYGISQPGFYASNALIRPHPALRAVSPQAPVTDRFKGDDDHHNGAFFLAQRYSFLGSFGRQRPVPTSQGAPGQPVKGGDGYRFFLEFGPLANLQRMFRWSNLFWNHETDHPNYDEFWQSRGMEQHFKNVKGPAVLTIGGFYDAEDLWGALHTYKALERQSPGLTNTLVMGPWSHGQWAGDSGERLGAIEFGSKTSDKFRNEIQFPFFEHYLRGGPDPKIPEAVVFESGANQWRTFDQWPPKAVRDQTYWLLPEGRLGRTASIGGKPVYETYVSDPRRPVPYTADPIASVPRSYMVENQRFAWTRPDVLSFQTEPLTADMTLAGPIQATLSVVNSQPDADFVVKVIDVYPDDAPSNTVATPIVRMAGYQMLVRWEVMRGRFRKSLEKPEPMTPGKPERVEIELNDVMHTFKKGHRLMVQVQSSMFPLVDRNPQSWVPNIYKAKETDFKPATIQIQVGGPSASRIVLPILPGAP